MGSDVLIWFSCIYIKYSTLRVREAIAQVYIQSLLSDFLIIYRMKYMYTMNVPLLWCSHHCVYDGFFSSFSFAFSECENCSTSSSVPFYHFRRVKTVSSDERIFIFGWILVRRVWIYYFPFLFNLLSFFESAFHFFPLSVLGFRWFLCEQ